MTRDSKRADKKATTIENVEGTPAAPGTELSQDELDGLSGGALGGFSARAFNPQPEPPKLNPISTPARRRR